jgi:hypothetical protein
MTAFIRNLDSASRDLVDMFKALAILGTVALVVICLGTYWLTFY